MLIEIICGNCRRSLKGDIDQGNNIGIDLCPDCLKVEKKAGMPNIAGRAGN